jgi:hypothetical protein
MRLSTRPIGLWLNSAGVADRVSEFAGLPTDPFVHVIESDEHGLWLKTNRADGGHVVLIRWEYIALIDVMLGGIKTKGLT